MHRHEHRHTARWTDARRRGVVGLLTKRAGGNACPTSVSVETKFGAAHILCVDNRERQKLIDQTLLQLDKQFGKGSVLRLGSTAVVPVSVISSGCIALDSALGVGGFPRGRVIEIYGP